MLGASVEHAASAITGGILPAGIASSRKVFALTSRAEPSSFSRMRTPGPPCAKTCSTCTPPPSNAFRIASTVANGTTWTCASPWRRRARRPAPTAVHARSPDRAAARVGCGDRDHDPQRPRQRPRRRRVDLPEHRHQPMQRQRHPRHRVRERLPRQPRPPRRPHPHPNGGVLPNRPPQHLAQRSATGGGRNEAANSSPAWRSDTFPDRSATAVVIPPSAPSVAWPAASPGSVGWVRRCPARARSWRTSSTALASPGDTPRCGAVTSWPQPTSRTSRSSAVSRRSATSPSGWPVTSTAAIPASSGWRSSIRETHAVSRSQPSAVL